MIDGTPGIVYGSTTALLFKNYVGKMTFLSSFFTDDFITHIAQQVISSGLCAIVGGTIGFFVHYYLTKLTKRNDGSDTISKERDGKS